MNNVVIFGYGITGILAYDWIQKEGKYNFLGFADNSVYKRRGYVCGRKIMSMDELLELKAKMDFKLIIAVNKWWEIADGCRKCGIAVEGFYKDGKLHNEAHMTFERLDLSEEIKLYAGDIADEIHKNDKNLYGLSITKTDQKHIFHNIMEVYPLPDNCIERYEAEEVFEYIPREKLKSVLNEICRILKHGSRCRITIPDFYSPGLRSRAMTDLKGNILFDPGSGGGYGENGVEGGGAVYFPTYDDFKEILEQTDFSSIDWLCYHTKDGELHKKYIDMNMGYNRRVKNETDEGVFCIVVDCFK